ncbi:putative T7SS-secreted protein [Streptomyces sp. C10-9-1]|uniref:putative T7SS-secreted protein n=1 Tax=Streptomyces sp. C10-9-1 TaxID=1859285 RepID=UPI003F4A52AE
MTDFGVIRDITGKGVDKFIETVDSGIDKGKEALGEGVDWATEKAGQGLRHYGYDGVAEVVEDWGDEAASSLGAEVGEQQLGQTEEANELVHGKPEKIAATAKNLRDFQRAFDLVGGGMKKLDASAWKGEAADSFRERFAPLPVDWMRAADAFESAAKALETYSRTITIAQGKAREAIALHREGENESKASVNAYNKKVETYNASRNTDNPLPHPGKFTDPGASKRSRARDILADAREARNEAADLAKNAVKAAMAHAPQEPAGMEKAKLRMMDLAMGQGVELAHFGGGIIKGTAGLANFVRSLHPLDAYNLTHPAEYYRSVNTTLAGLASTAANPDRALRNAWESAKGDPSEFIGRLVPELIGTKGAGALRGGLRAGMRRGLDDHPTNGMLRRQTSRGSGGEIPSPEEIKRAVMESNPQILARKWPDDDGRYYATRVLKGGRPDGETVFAGHGFREIDAGTFTVPEGTKITFYIPDAERIPGLNGVAVEGGSYPRGGYYETFEAGQQVPDYTLAPPAASGGGGFSVYENSTTVASKVQLSELLKEDMGNVHWAACREIR